MQLATCFPRSCRGWVLRAGYLALFFYLPNLLVVPWAWRTLNDDDPFLMIVSGCLLGFYVGQLNLICVWLAFATESLILRVPLTGFWGLSHWLCFVAGNHLYDYGWPSLIVDMNEYVVLLAFLVMGVVIGLIPLLIARYLFDWRLGVLDHDESTAAHFGLRQLFIAVLLIAVTLGLVRIAARPDQGGDLLWTNSVFMAVLPVFLTHVGINLLLVMPCVWAAFHSTLTTRNLLLALLIASMAGWLVPAGLSRFGGYPALELKWYLVFSSFYFGQMAVVFVTMYTLKQTRYQLSRTSSRSRRESGHPA